MNKLREFIWYCTDKAVIIPIALVLIALLLIAVSVYKEEALVVHYHFQIVPQALNENKTEIRYL